VIIMAVRAKVVCNFKAEQGNGTQIAFGPVYEGSEENKRKRGEQAVLRL